jgi:hypothetical protein
LCRSITGVANVYSAGGFTSPQVSTGGTSDGFFMKLDAKGFLRHVVLFKGAKAGGCTRLEFSCDPWLETARLQPLSLPLDPE